MKFLILLATFVAITNCVPIDRGSQKFSDRPKPIGDINGSIKGEYTYVDPQGLTHEVKYEAGPQIGFKIIEDKIIQEQTTTTTTPKPIQHVLPFVKPGETIRVHHLRNEVPATVHRTTVPDIVHSEEPPPIRSFRKFFPPSLSPTATIFAPKTPQIKQTTQPEKPNTFTFPSNQHHIIQNHFSFTPDQPLDLSSLSETVKVHHLRNEVPADVHKTTVPDIVHSQSPPPIRSRKPRDVTQYRFDGRISGLTPEQAANIEAQNAYMQALNLLLPQIRQIVQEQGEIIIPVHHVHHVHKLGHIQATTPQISVHSIRVTGGNNGLNIEHVPLHVQRRLNHHHIKKRDVGKEEDLGKKNERTFSSRADDREYRRRIVSKNFPLASDVKLIEGYTPEVWEARRTHLANFAAISEILPKLDEVDEHEFWEE